MVDTINEKSDLDVEPTGIIVVDKHTQTGEHEDCARGSTGRSWDLSFRENFDALEHHFHRDEKGFQSAERTMYKAFRN